MWAYSIREISGWGGPTLLEKSVGGGAYSIREISGCGPTLLEKSVGVGLLY